NLTRTAHLLPKFPPVNRDLSLLLDEDVTWGQLSDVVETIAQPLRISVDYVTTYRGKQTPKGKKSVTIALEYRSSKGTLTGQQVDEQIDEVLSALGKTFGAELRQ
ncbi:MAG: phenylalanine--tRNA ligase subunit beta, partial [Phycisphaerae bacterium]|nr:phenylalanine--tRNA ligase subunit beta [Phycisphaerae bacterium]